MYTQANYVKYRTNFIITGSRRAQAYQLDVEAQNPSEGARKAESHWKSELPTSEGAIHVYEIDPGTGEARAVVALIHITGRTQFQTEHLDEQPTTPPVVKRRRPKSSKKRKRRSHR
jgi:hypothetical protein